MTKADFISLQNEVRYLAMDIGLRPAARAMGLSEQRVRNWSHRNKWRISAISPAIQTLNAKPSETTAIEAKLKLINHYGDRAKLGACIAGSKAMEHLADSNGEALCKPANAISADQWTKAVDRAAGWTQARAQGIAVNVAVITPPSDTERAERKAVHAQLDAITRLLES